LIKMPPKYLKISSAVRYRREAIAEWLEPCPTGGGHQAEGR
jgi:hypothetical protein